MANLLRQTRNDPRPTRVRFTVGPILLLWQAMINVYVYAYVDECVFAIDGSELNTRNSRKKHPSISRNNDLAFFFFWQACGIC